MNLDFLQGIKQKLVSYLGLDNKPVISPLPQHEVVAKQPSHLETIIKNGMNRYSNPPPPVATLSAQLAQAGEGLPEPLLPAIMALMESGGLKYQSSPNNTYNLGPGINYPTPEASIIGGGPRNQQGFMGVLHSGLYDKYLKSGNLEDFFNTFTPPGVAHNNPTLEELLQSHDQIKSNFY